MITYLHHRNNGNTIARLLNTLPEARTRLRPMTYDVLFRRRRLPGGSVIFTDFDYLTTPEIDAAARAARVAAEQGARVLNNPGQVLERYALLRRLRADGLNPVDVQRLDEGRLPKTYPVFVRIEHGALGPETDLIHDEAQYLEHLARLRAQGRTLKGRICTSFCSEPDGDGFFRKYGAFVVAGRIIPQHILRAKHWVVKSRLRETDAAFNAEEAAFVADNPHAEDLEKICRTAEIDFGRIDYTVDGNRLVVFEINTNPTFPRFTGGDPSREPRRKLIAQQLMDAFDAVDTRTPPACFTMPREEIPARFVRHAQFHEDFPASLVSRKTWAGVRRRLLGRSH